VYLIAQEQQNVMGLLFSEISHLNDSHTGLKQIAFHSPKTREAELFKE